MWRSIYLQAGRTKREKNALKDKINLFTALIILGVATAVSAVGQNDQTSVYLQCRVSELPVRKKIASDNDLIYFISQANKLNAFDVSNFSKIWEFDFILDGTENISITKKKIEITKNRKKYTIETKTGIPKKITESQENSVEEQRIFTESKKVLQFELNDVSTSLSEKTSGNNLYGYKNGNLILYANSKEKIIWKKKVGGEVSSIVQNEKYFLVGSNDNFLYNFEKKNGNLIWKKRFSGRILNIFPISERNSIIIISGENRAEFIDNQSSKLLGNLKIEPNEEIIFIQKRKDNSLILYTSKAIRLYSELICN